MKSIYIPLTTKLFSLIGASLNSVGFLTFFFWEPLEPYRWHMIFVGVAMIILSELAGVFFVKKFSQEVNYEAFDSQDEDGNGE